MQMQAQWGAFGFFLMRKWKNSLFHSAQFQNLCAGVRAGVGDREGHVCSQPDKQDCISDGIVLFVKWNKQLTQQNWDFQQEKNSLDKHGWVFFFFFF